MNHEDLQSFAAAWLAAWNRHDIDAVLAHFHEDASFASPIAQQLGLPGQLQGRAAIRAYWQQALARVPDLHFRLLGLYAGVDIVVLHYQNQKGVTVCEVLHLREGKVSAGYGTYALSTPNPAGLQSVQ